MNLVRNLLGSALTCALAVAVSTGCQPKKPAGTNPPGGAGGSTADAGGGGGDGSGADGGGADGGGADGGGADGGGAAPANCEAKVADAPTPLFGEKVLIRPPINVELVEESPMYATTYASAGFVSACDATVDRMHVFVFQNDPKKGLDKHMDEFVNDYLVNAGYKDGKRRDNFVSSDTDFHTAVDYPAAGGKPPAVLYIAAARRFDTILTVVYETRPDEFPVLKPTFKASAESILALPPDA